MKESMPTSESEMYLNEHFEEGFAAFKSWLQEQGVTNGTITMKNWGSGDAKTTLHYRTENGGGGIGLGKFAEGFEWYFQSKHIGNADIKGLADGLKDLLAEYNIDVKRE